MVFSERHFAVFATINHLTKLLRSPTLHCCVQRAPLVSFIGRLNSVKLCFFISRFIDCRHYYVCLVTWPWIGSEAGGDLVLIQTLLLFILC